jgi:O-antigen/teichoic acid export membrane protein
MTIIQTYKKIRNNRHFDNFKKFAIGGILTILLGYISTYLINKHLSKEDLGLFSYHQSVMILLTSIFSMGVHHAYLRYNNESVNQKELANIIGLFLFSYLLFENVYISVISFIILFNERIYFYRSSKRIRRMNVLKYLYYSILIILLYSFIYYGGIDYEKVILALGGGYLLIYIVDVVYGKNHFLQSDNSKIIIPVKEIFLYSLPLAGAEVVRWILQYSDQVLMKEFLTVIELANYAIAVRVLNVIQIFTSLFLLYYPMLYFEEADKKNFKIIKSIRLGFIFLLCFVAVVLIFLRKPLYIAMGAEQYLNYTYIFVILIIAEVTRIVGSLFLTFRTYRLQTWFTTLTILVSAVFAISCNFIFLPRYGIIVAAIVQVVTSVIYLLLVYFLAIRQERDYFRLQV